MHRFYVPPEAIAGGEAAIQGDAARQIARVLRMQTGDTICLFDGLGDEYIVRLTSFGRDEAVLGVVAACTFCAILLVPGILMVRASKRMKRPGWLDILRFRESGNANTGQPQNPATQDQPLADG